MELSIFELSHKPTLTIEEASEYTGIGINKLRSLTSEYGCSFALHIGNKTLIKREKFEKYLSEAPSI